LNLQISDESTNTLFTRDFQQNKNFGMKQIVPESNQFEPSNQQEAKNTTEFPDFDTPSSVCSIVTKLLN